MKVRGGGERGGCWVMQVRGGGERGGCWVMQVRGGGERGLPNNECNRQTAVIFIY